MQTFGATPACWRCGGSTHVAKGCKAAPRCLTCADKGKKDVAHDLGSGSCPIFRVELRRLRGGKRNFYSSTSREGRKPWTFCCRLAKTGGSMCCSLVSKTSTASGIDGVPNEILKEVIGANPEILLEAFNSCFREGRFFIDWKKQRLGLLRKGNKPLGVALSYRPTCLLDMMGKLLEELILQHLQADTWKWPLKRPKRCWSWTGDPLNTRRSFSGNMELSG